MTRPVQTSARPNAGLFEQLDRETWFVDRMQEHGAAGVFGLLSGLTDQATRRARIRDAVLANGLRTVIIGRRNGKSETYEQCFARLFGEALTGEK